jgi:hypothetical protein
MGAWIEPAGCERLADGIRAVTASSTAPRTRLRRCSKSSFIRDRYRRHSVSVRYLEMEAPDSISIEEVHIEALPGNWRSDPEATRGTGDEWLHSGRTALLRVPP